MPRSGLGTASVVAAGAELADEVGIADLSMGALAQRVGVRTPSLYNHVAGQDDLTRQIAALALAEAADAVGTALQENPDREALTAAGRAFRDFVLAHPGRYAATIGLQPTGPDDPVAVAGTRLLDSFRVVLGSYSIRSDEADHALRAMRSAFHGFATLQSANGFQWPTDIDESFEWLLTVVDQGLQAMSSPRPDDAAAPEATLA